MCILRGTLGDSLEHASDLIQPVGKATETFLHKLLRQLLVKSCCWQHSQLALSTRYAPQSEKAFRQSHRCSTESSLQQAEESTEGCGQDTKSLHAYGPGAKRRGEEQKPHSLNPFFQLYCFHHPPDLASPTGISQPWFSPFFFLSNSLFSVSS